MKVTLIAAALTGLTLTSAAFAGATGIDGVIGADWTGITPVRVNYDASAPTSNFGSPGSTSNVTGYNVYTRGDASYFYVGLQADSTTTGLDFANLYFSNGYGGNPATTSGIGFEVNNSRAFKPGVGGYYPYTTASSGIEFAVVPGTIEAAFPYTVFTANTVGVAAFTNTTDFIRLSLSQSFGYSVAGGTPSYGFERLGLLNLPEPTAAGLLAMLPVLALRRRKAC